MQAFIQVGLGNNTFYSFRQPIMQWLKANAPAITTLDIDAHSDEMLVTHACSLLQEAGQYAIYFKITEPNAAFGTAFKVIEQIIRENKPALIIVEGTHARLKAIIQARPQLLFAPAETETAVQQHLITYFKLG